MLTSTGKKAIGLRVMLTFLASLLLSLRMLQRRKRYGIDDWLLVIALIFVYLQFVGSVLVAAKGGEGKHMTELTPSEMDWLFKMIYWPEYPYTIAVSLVKISILISYNRIFGRLKWFRVAAITLGVLSLMWCIGVLFAVIFNCTPVEKSWKPMVPGHCVDLIPFLLGNSVSNTILDYMILLLPIVPVWKLQISSLQRVLLLFAFSLGSLAAISSTVRAARTKTVDYADLSATVYEDSMWTYVEPCAGIMSACLPYLANLAGQRFLQMIQVVSSIARRTGSLLRLRSSSDRAMTGSSASDSIGMQKMAVDSRGSTPDKKPTFRSRKEEYPSQESVSRLV